MAYAALVPSTSLGVKAADDAADAEWFPVAKLPQPLAFDHKEVVRTAFGRLKEQKQVVSNGDALCFLSLESGFVAAGQTPSIPVVKLDADPAYARQPRFAAVAVQSAAERFGILTGPLVEQLDKAINSLQGPWDPPKG